MDNRILICTDLDRTLLPNGEQPESPEARQRFTELAQHPQVDIAYVTGRHKALVLEAIEKYQLPTPNYVLGDVGSSIYELKGDSWHLWNAWQEQIATDWNGLSHDEIHHLCSEINSLKLQESEKQNTYKVSYYTPENIDINWLNQLMQERLKQHDIHASLIWSIDDLKHIGLLDVLPEKATKLHAIEFLMKEKGYAHERTVFAGDSGNDLPVLASHLQSVLVANARNDVREQAISFAKKLGFSNALYIARGGYMGMNGNYAAGILEGVAHYIPDILS